MPCVSLQRKLPKFQETGLDLEVQLFELGFLCEKDDALQMIFFTGKEKDEESSLYYCEQRYYAAHISRWVSTAPTWLEDGINIYAYVHGNPVSGVDPSGTGTVDDIDKANIERIKTKTEKAKNSIGCSDEKVDEYESFQTLSDDEKQKELQRALKNNDIEYFDNALFDAWEEGSDFLSDPENKDTIKALKYIMKKSNKEKKESGFVTYKGKQFGNIKENLGIGTKDGLTESVDINRLYEPDRQISDTLYGVHAHFNESAMSYNVASIDKKTGFLTCSFLISFTKYTIWRNFNFFIIFHAT